MPGATALQFIEKGPGPEFLCAVEDCRWIFEKAQKLSEKKGRDTRHTQAAAIYEVDEKGLNDLKKRVYVTGYTPTFHKESSFKKS